MSRRQQPESSVPARYVQMVLEVAGRCGLGEAEVLHGTGLRAGQLGAPELRVSARDSARAIQNAIELTGNPGLGIEIGLQSKPTAHGDLGFAAMSASTLGEALALVTRFLRLRIPEVELRVFADGSRIVMESRDRQRMSPFLRRFIQECVIVGLYQMGTTLLVNHAPADADMEIWFDWPEPEYFERYRARLPRTRFEMPTVQLRFAAAYRDEALRLADREAVRQSVEQCEREMTLLEADDVVERVRGLLVLGSRGFPGFDSVARRLGMSGRTLTRKLKERGHPFRTLLDEARLREARRLLANSHVGIQQVAAALGYSDPACFTRAFRRWSGGETPSRARARMTS
jgi:AraC-like DNA-binding protein